MGVDTLPQMLKQSRLVHAGAAGPRYVAASGAGLVGFQLIRV